MTDSTDKVEVNRCRKCGAIHDVPFPTSSTASFIEYLNCADCLKAIAHDQKTQRQDETRFEFLLRRLVYYDSENRIEGLIEILNEENDGAIFWPIFCRGWSACDDAYGWNKELSVVLAARRLVDINWLEYLPEIEREFYEALPEHITVWRGGEASRIVGISWTVDKIVAESFASGHRGIRNRNPVISKIERLPKSLVLAVCAGREESELLLNVKAASEWQSSIQTYPLKG